MLATDRRKTRGRPLVPLLQRAVAGGLEVVQVVERDLPDAELEELVREIRRAVGRGVRIIVQGHSRVARHNHGLHLSVADLPLPARHWEEGEWLVGRTVRDAPGLAAALEEGVSYVVFDETYPAGANDDGKGLERLRELVREAGSTPVYAAGGITIGRIPPAVHAGAWGVVARKAILEATHPERVAEAMVAALRVSGMPGE
jgi:thiamine-phosphate pyrophosphorylase